MSEYKIISKLEPHSSISEQYRKLRTSIDFSSFNKDLKVINLTSAFPGEGKTVTCINLATVYAQSKQKTLMIDMDLRKPKIHRAFGLSNKGGLSDFITTNLAIEKNIHKIDKYLDVLVSGSKIPFPSEVLVSDKIKGMVEYLKTKYDKIIIDTPPLTAVADATIVSNFSDGTVFVIASRKTNSDVAQDVLKQLKDSGANVLGGILTKVKKLDTDFYDKVVIGNHLKDRYFRIVIVLKNKPNKYKVTYTDNLVTIVFDEDMI